MSTLAEELRRADKTPGWMTLKELTWLQQIASRSYKILEIGVFKGRSSIAIASATPGLHVTVDHWKASPYALDPKQGAFQELYAKDGVAKVRQMFLDHMKPYIDNGKTLALELDLEIESCVSVLRSIARFKKFDFLFVDGDHEPPAVRKNMLDLLPLCSPDAVISGHDGTWRWVEETVREFLPVWSAVRGKPVEYKLVADSIWQFVDTE